MSTTPTAQDIDIEIAPTNDPAKYRVVYRHTGKLLALDAITLGSQAARTRVSRAAAKAAYPADAAKEEVEALARDLAGRLLAAAENPPTVMTPDVPIDPTADDPRGPALDEMDADVRAEAEELLAAPDLLHRVHDDIRALGVVGESCLALLVYLIGVSAQLSKPLAAIVRGLTASGKSFVLARVATLFPPEVVLNATSLTTNALYYFEPGQLRHRFVVAGERSRLENDDRAEATRALREMIESGQLSKAVPMKEEDRIVTRVITQEGPIAYIETTTLTDIFAEDANRCLLIGTDESDAQTRRVLMATAHAAAGLATADVARRVAVHHAVLRMLPRTDVVIPFAPAIASLFVLGEDARRRLPQVLQLAKASALLHFRQRDRDTHGRIVADRRDYQVAVRLAAGPLAVARGGIGITVRQFFERVRSSFPSLCFSSGDLVAARYGGRTVVYSRLSELASKGLIVQVNPPKGKVPAQWRVTGEQPRPDTGGVPTVEEVSAWLAAQTGTEVT